MSAKYILRIIAVVVVLYLAIPYLLRGIFWVLYPPVRISYATSVTGRITGIDMNRHYYLHHLDGNTRQYYDFNAFVPASSKVDRDSLSQDEENELVLGAHLRTGDQITKEAHSATLTVRHGNSVSQWVCPPVALTE